MKWLFGILFPVMAFAQSSKPVQLSGTLRLAQPADKVYISYRTPDAAVTDSITLKNDAFNYKTTLAEPTLAQLWVRYKNRTQVVPERIPVFLQPGTITLTATDSLKAYTVTGSAAHADYEKLAALQKPYNDSLNKLYEAWDRYNSPKDKEAQQAVETQIDSVDARLRETVYKVFAQQHPQSPVALYAVKQYAGYDIDAAKTEPLFSALSAGTRALPSAVAFKEAIDIAKKTGVGSMAMDFTQPDTSGNAVSLSQFRGQYVLVDFWASWCGPCRNENPNVVKAFQEYGKKGFTVLGVSLDRPGAKDRWLKAIHTDSLTWTHVSDLKFWDNAVAKQYGIRAIPQNFLIDPQGKIIGRNLRGSALTQKLASVFGSTASF